MVPRRGEEDHHGALPQRRSGEEGKMKQGKSEEEAARLAMILLRFLRHWDQAELAHASGRGQSQISAYHHGEVAVPREVLEKIASEADFPSHLLDALLWGLRSFVVAARGRTRADRVLANGTAAELIALIRTVEDVILEPLARCAPVPAASPLDREEAAALWERLKPLTAEEQLLVVEEASEYQNWALCERLAAESREAAASHPQKALELSELALRVAELAPAGEAWRRRLKGYALFHRANGYRVCQKAAERDAALLRASRLWREGELGDPGLLNEAIPLWIEAALRRSQRRFPEALKRIDEALAIEQGELRGKMLLSKSSIFQILGDAEGSSVALTEAAPLIDPGREPREAFGLQFNLAVDLCCSGRFKEAASTLGNVRELAQNLGGELDLARVAWLEGKVAAGLGQSAEAETTFEQARGVFRARELAYDYALVSLDLSLVLLREGRSGEVRKIAEEMLWIFKDQGVAQEALAALRIFCEAARREAATVELMRQVASFLRRVQLDPELRFEVGGGPV
jgi:tetratricopeptide (TPR) repeat protein